MSYSYNDLKSLQAEQQKWVKKAEDYHKLAEAAKEARDGLDSALQNLKTALSRLGNSVWSGPDAEACRGTIEEILAEMGKQRSSLQQTMTTMSLQEQKARERAREIGEKIMYEVLPNMSFGGKVATTVDYYL